MRSGSALATTAKPDFSGMCMPSTRLLSIHSICATEAQVGSVAGNLRFPVMAYETLAKILVMAAVEKARRVCVRTFPDLLRVRPSAVTVISSGVSAIATMSY
jgi:hypothetical protein